jgi:hypothetical protein
MENPATGAATDVDYDAEDVRAWKPETHYPEFDTGSTIFLSMPSHEGGPDALTKSVYAQLLIQPWPEHVDKTELPKLAQRLGITLNELRRCLSIIVHSGFVATVVGRYRSVFIPELSLMIDDLGDGWTVPETTNVPRILGA